MSEKGKPIARWGRKATGLSTGGSRLPNGGMLKTADVVNNGAFANRALDRREFLRLGGAGIVGAAFLGLASPAKAGPLVSAHSLGIREGNSPSRNRENLVKALTDSKKEVVFQPGDYRLDNSGSYIVIRNFGGKIVMRPGARFVFMDNTTRGLMFERGSGARFHGLRSVFASQPKRRVSAQECILFIKSSDTLVRNANIQGSAAAGLLFGRCVRPTVNGARIRDTMADGLHFANCKDPRAHNVTTVDTGDDGLAFVNYDNSTNYTGGKATNITVRRSGARGIAVVGQSDVTIDGFKVVTTRANGLYCAHEPKSFNTRVPENVLFRNGSVHRGGKVNGTPGTNYGINISGARSARVVDVDVIRPGARGVSSLIPGGGVVRLVRVKVRGARESGFNLQGGTHYLNGLVTRNSGGTGIYISDCRRVGYGGLWSINSSRNDPLDRAFSFERNRRIRGRAVNVMDTRKRVRGNRLNASGKQHGRLGKIYDRVSNGKVRVANQSDLNYRGPVRA